MKIVPPDQIRKAIWWRNRRNTHTAKAFSAEYFWTFLINSNEIHSFFKRAVIVCYQKVYISCCILAQQIKARNTEIRAPASGHEQRGAGIARLQGKNVCLLHGFTECARCWLSGMPPETGAEQLWPIPFLEGIFYGMENCIGLTSSGSLYKGWKQKWFWK